MVLKIAIRLLLAASIIAVILWVSDLETLSDIGRIGAGPVLLVLAMTALLTFTSAWRWRVVLRRLHPAEMFSFFPVFRSIALGLGLGLIVSQDVGLASSRIAYLNRGRSMTMRDASYSALFDRWLDVLILAALAPASILFAAGVLDLRQAAIVMIAMLGALAGVGLLRPSALTWAFVWGFGVATYIIRKTLRRGGGRFALIDGLDEELDRTRLLYALGLSVARLGAVALRAWFVVLALDLEISAATALLLVPIAQVTLLIPITPGGLGIYDAGWYGVLISSGVGNGAAAAFVLWHRVLSTLSLLAVIGVTEAAWQVWKFRSRPHQRAAATGR